MKRATTTVWTTNDGKLLLSYTATPMSIQIIPAVCDRSTLRQLGEAIADALGREWGGEEDTT